MLTASDVVAEKEKNGANGSSPSKNKKFELMLTRRAKAYISSCSQTVSLYFQPFRRDFYGGTALRCPGAQVSLNIKNRDLDRQNLVQRWKFHMQLFMSISIGFGTIRSWNVSRSLKSPKNP